MARRIVIAHQLDETAINLATEHDIGEIVIGIPPALASVIDPDSLPTVYTEPEQPAPDAPNDPFGDALTFAVRYVIAGHLTGASGLPDDVVSQVAPLFPAWTPDLAVAVGAVYQWDGTLVECLTAHTTQADWTPDVTPALWRVHRTPPEDGGAETWQPGIAVAVGERLTYDGHLYEVVQSHTTQAGWEPPAVPSLWRLVEGGA